MHLIYKINTVISSPCRWAIANVLTLGYHTLTLTNFCLSAIIHHVHLPMFIKPIKEPHSIPTPKKDYVIMAIQLTPKVLNSSELG